MAPSLETTSNGMTLENPFLLASGPPGTNAKVIAKSWDLGWAGTVIKTISLDSSKVVNTNPRYAKLKSRVTGEVVGFQNIELISDRPFETWLHELRELKRKYPTKLLVASIMEEFSKEAWQRIVTEVQATGVDAFEMNLSCPHGLPERKMGQFMGEDPEIVCEVVKWVAEVAEIPVWAKMTPNVGDVTAAPKMAVSSGADGISAINTILSVTGIDFKTLRPLPTVEGHTVPGGYSGQAVRPIALRQIMEIAKACPDVPISGMGGIEDGKDAAEFLLMGATTLQVCTGAMLRGYGCIAEMNEQLLQIMTEHGFDSPGEMVGKCLPHFTTHYDLVARQQQAKVDRVGKQKDSETWQGDIAGETEALSTN